MMRSVAILSVVALAAGIVIPDEAVAAQLALKPLGVEAEASADVTGWEAAISAFDTFEPDAMLEMMQELEPEDEHISEGPHHPHHPPHPPHHPPHDHPPHHHDGHHGHHHKVNMTALDILAASNYTKIFSYLITTYSPELTALLNATVDDPSNYTVFAPLDHGFKKIHRHFKHHHPDKEPKKPSNETIEKFLSYHVVEGKKPFLSLYLANTLPTLLDGGDELGGPQRIKIGHGILGVYINFMSKIIFPNYVSLPSLTPVFGEDAQTDSVKLETQPSSNGVLHFLSFPIIPPPTQYKLISLFPSAFSTLSLALSKTGLDESFSSLSSTGGTFFAPTNRAFSALGAEINAFLFNTDKGLKILKALLKYHFVADQTLYTDAFYKPEPDSSSRSSDFSLASMTTSDADGAWEDVRDEEAEAGFGAGDEASSVFPGKSYHIDLPTLLREKSLGVDIRRGPLGTKMLVNKHVPIGTFDVPAKDGVVQLPRRVLLPPHPHRHPDGFSEDEMSVEAFVERVGGFAGEEDWNEEL
ncbi:FAS1 domain-containing protein [Zalerion maritima]|uniref:FAS1 domain-containing protein n=1 Tax=Zalerion maritima TaxID=339359 RepID=A0AAD5WWL5_9PEZI|nr:FAS1 domain-containing protein [Zalerion maritima]